MEMKYDMPQTTEYRTYVKRYEELILKSDRTSNEDTELAQLQTLLNPYIVRASDYNGIVEEIENHELETNAHSATSLSTANRIPIRDSAGQFNVGTPTSSTHVTTKGYVDTANAATLKKDGSEEMSGPLRMTRSSTLGSTVNAISDFLNLAAQTGTNTVKFFTRLVRAVTGTDWTTVDLEIGRITDSTTQQKIIFGGNGDITLIPTSGKNARVNNNIIYHQGYKPQIREFWFDPTKKSEDSGWTSQSTSWKLMASISLGMTPMYTIDTPKNPSGFPRRKTYNGTFSASFDLEDTSTGNIHYIELRMQIGQGAEVVIGSAQTPGGIIDPIIVVSSPQNIDTTDSVTIRAYTRTTDTSTSDRHRVLLWNDAQINQYFVVEN